MQCATYQFMQSTSELLHRLLVRLLYAVETLLHARFQWSLTCLLLQRCNISCRLDNALLQVRIFLVPCKQVSSQRCLHANLKAESAACGPMHSTSPVQRTPVLPC
jgi:hypothetical protein